jgi:hypothetical protein
VDAAVAAGECMGDVVPVVIRSSGVGTGGVAVPAGSAGLLVSIQAEQIAMMMMPKMNAAVVAFIERLSRGQFYEYSEIIPSECRLFYHPDQIGIPV